MLSLSDNNQADVSEAFNSSLKYLDNLLNFDNPFFRKKWQLRSDIAHRTSLVQNVYLI